MSAEHRFVTGLDEAERSECLQSEARRRGRRAGGGVHLPNLGRPQASSKKENAIHQTLIEL
jgi:hypothetical protein